MLRYSSAVVSLWRWLTEPVMSVIQPVERRRARAVASMLLLTAALALMPLLEDGITASAPLPLLALMIIILFSYTLSRTRFYRLGGMLAIAALWVLPIYTFMFGGYSSMSFTLALVRLALLSLLFAYILFSFRVSLVLTVLMTLAFLFVPLDANSGISLVQLLSDFLVTAMAIFYVFLIIRQFDDDGYRQTERALSVSEERYRAIVEIQTEMICRWLPDLTITFVNEAYCRYFNLTREQLIGSMVLGMIYEPDLPHVSQMIQRISLSLPSITYEHRVLISGEVRWHQWTDHAIFNAQGEIVEFQSVGRDITVLKRAEAAEREQRQFAEALASTAALISSTLSHDEVLDRILSQVALVSPFEAAEILLIEGDLARIVRSRRSLEAPPRASVLNMTLVINETRNLREMVETGKPFIATDVLDYEGWQDMQGTEWIRSTVSVPIRLEGETIGFLNVDSEKPGRFTERHATQLQAFADQAAIAIRNARLYAEVRHYASELEALVNERTAELELVHQRLRVILDGTGEGIFYTESENIQYVNSAFCQLTGYRQHELIGKNISFLRVDEQGFAALLDSSADGSSVRGIWRGDSRFRRKDGSQFDAALTVSPIGERGTFPPRAVTVVRDVSREKALQAQRSNLVAYASHELRTPITNMKTRLYLLRRRPDRLEDHLAILDEVTGRMQHLVQDLLDISRLEHGLIPINRTDLILQQVVDKVVLLQQSEAEAKDLDLRLLAPDKPITVSGDRERLIQVLTNLVTNALNYTPAGGTVSVVVRVEDGSAIIEVEDTGIGITEENLLYIFQPFYRVISEVEGTGLGLSIAKEIIDMHGGSITVRSKPGEGSCFTVRLPLVKPIRV